MLRVSDRWLGFILFSKSQLEICSFVNFTPSGEFKVVKLLTSCFLGCIKPAFTTLKNKSVPTCPPPEPAWGLILIIAESTFGDGQKQ